MKITWMILAQVVTIDSHRLATGQAQDSRPSVRASLAGFFAVFTSLSPAIAEDFRYLAGAQIVSNYVASGVSQSAGKPALQMFFEAVNRGFYAGTFLSTIDMGEEDRGEIDFFAGYRKRLESGLFVNVAYRRFLKNVSGDCCGEFQFTAAYPVHTRLGLGGYVSYNPQLGTANRRASAIYKATESFAVAGAYGQNEIYNHDYWTLGATYEFDNFWSVGLIYHGAESGDEGLVLRLSVANSQTALVRLVTAPFQR